MTEQFTGRQIIKQICKERIKIAEKRDNQHYATRLIGGSNPNGRPAELDAMLPPRRVWNSFRPRRRAEGGKANFVTLFRAVMMLRQQQPSLPWVQNLNHFVAEIQSRVLGSAPFKFSSPGVSWLLKPEKKHEYRALCIFSLQDNIIASLFAQYLRDTFDPGFSDCSFAFRARNAEGQIPNHHAAFNKLHQLKSSHPKQDYYVAEADITGFFDSVDHAVAITAFDSAASRHQLHPRAREIFRAYLACYSFSQNVLAEAEPRLKRREGQEAFFSKPQGMVSGESAVGVPQGGAVSGIIANLVLDEADKCVERERDRLGAEIHYYRYCDDMILTSPVKKHCKSVFKVYLAALDRLKLAYHPAKKTWIYSKGHWNHKSKSVYRWSGEKWFGCVPWVQFVGYQIRYDGLVRVRKGAFKTQAIKFAEFTSKIKHTLLNASQSRTLVVTRAKAMNSFASKLMAKGVGWSDPYSQGPKPMCWSGGFKALHQKPLVTSVLRKLDSLRQRQIFRFGDSNINFKAGFGVGENGELKDPKNSYSAQFQDAGGRQLIENPWRPANWIEQAQAVIFMFCKWMVNLPGLLTKSVKRLKKRIKHIFAHHVKVEVGEEWSDTKFNRNHVYEVLQVGWLVRCRNVYTRQIRYIPRVLFDRGRYIRLTTSTGRFV